MERTGRMPNMIQAGTYSAVLQYLKAIDAAGTDATEPVAAKLHEMPVDDLFAQGGKVGPNGRMFHDMYLMEVKTPDGEPGRLGLLRRPRDRSRRRGLHRPGRERLPARHRVTAMAAPADAPELGAPVLSARGLRKEFAGFVAVKNVDIDVRDGQIKALIGPNGAGKSTVFNLLTKFLIPTAGRIEFLGQDITKLDPAKVARLGLVRSFQISAVFPYLSVLDNVRVALQRPQGLGHQFWLGLRSLDRLNARARELLEAVGLERHADALAADLSYGRKRVLEIATTLALEPRVLLLDEPMAGMGHEDVDHVSALIRRVAKRPGGADGRAQPQGRRRPLRRDRRAAARRDHRRGRLRHGQQRPAGARGLHGDVRCLKRCSRSPASTPGTARATSCTASTSRSAAARR